MKSYPFAALLILVLIIGYASYSSCEELQLRPSSNLEEQVGSTESSDYTGKCSADSLFEGLSPFDYAEKHLGKRPEAPADLRFLGWQLNAEAQARYQIESALWDQVAQRLIQQRLELLGERTNAGIRSKKQQYVPQGTPNSVVQDHSQGGLLGKDFLGPYTPNAYGPGINADATGRHFIWQPETAGPKVFDPFLQVQPNAFGPGIGMDQYGRPVRPACPPGWTGPC